MTAYRYLDLSAPGIRCLLDSVQLVDGKMSLAALFFSPVPLSSVPVGSTTPGPAGIAHDSAGNVYVADPGADRVLRIDTCGGDPVPVGCLAQMLSAPRGIAVGPRDALYVADSGNHRIVVVDLATFQVRSVWGQTDPYGGPVAGSAAGALDDPWDLAIDGESRVIVVDHGNRRLQRFDLDGNPDSDFADALNASGQAPRQPERLAIAQLHGEEWLLVVDRIAPMRTRLLVFDGAGAVRGAETSMLERSLAQVEDLEAGPGAVACAGTSLHIAAPATGRLLSFDLERGFLGSVANYSGGAAGIVLATDGRLLLNPGDGTPLALLPGALAATGAFRVGPFSVAAGPTTWRALTAIVDAPPDARTQLFTLTADTPGDPPSLDDSRWTGAPPNAPEVLIAGDRQPYLWIGGQLTAGTGRGPTVSDFRVDLGDDPWLGLLPAMFSRDDTSRLLEPALAVLEGGLAEEDALIDRLPVLFDPAAAPAAWLEWLAGWLAFELEPTMTEADRRAAIAEAFAVEAIRGTAEGLRQVIKLVLGLDTAIVEPAQRGVWSLGKSTGTLGFDTALAAADADGAVLDSAELDRARLQDATDYGAPLYLDVVNRFCVRVHAAQLARAGGQAALAALVERERPAETCARVCVVEPRARVAVQARVGVDAVVARESEPLVIGGDAALDSGAALAATQPSPAIVGARLGRRLALI